MGRMGMVDALRRREEERIMGVGGVASKRF